MHHDLGGEKKKVYNKVLFYIKGLMVHISQYTDFTYKLFVKFCTICIV